MINTLRLLPGLFNYPGSGFSGRAFVTVLRLSSTTVSAHRSLEDEGILVPEPGLFKNQPGSSFLP